ncbi:hypothetical protein CL653_01865 [bacterium]|nr:hypothetical protein [bacterium]
MIVGSKHKLIRLIVTRLLIVVVFLLCLLLAKVLWERFHVMHEAAIKRVDIENERGVLESKKHELEERLEYLGSEASFEAKIRENFDMIKKGEQVVVIVGEDNYKAENLDIEYAPKRSWYKFWR